MHFRTNLVGTPLSPPSCDAHGTGPVVAGAGGEGVLLAVVSFAHWIVKDHG